MAHVWKEEGNEWRATPVESEPAVAPGVRLLPFRTAQESGWAMIEAPGAGGSANGERLLTGIRVLADRDAIRAPGYAGFFSTETLAQVEPFPGDGTGSPQCVRCRQPLAAGQSAVRCPQCGAWHHQLEELPCWTFLKTCASCPQSTEMDAGFQRTPEEL